MLPSRAGEKSRARRSFENARRPRARAEVPQAPERARAAAELRSCRARACVAKALDEPCAPLSAAALEVPSANVRHPRARAAVPQALKQKSTDV